MQDPLSHGGVTPLMERILYEVKRIVVGQDHFLERVLVAILAQATCWSRVFRGSPRRSR
jgi:MoxR-like ATPase